MMEALQFSFSVPRFIALKAISPLNKKAYYDGKLATVKLVDVPEPRLPGESWVKIQVKYCGFCGSDMNLIFLKDSPSASPFTSMPCIMGHEFCGEIVEKGADVKGFDLGDIVAVAPHLGCEARKISPICPNCRTGRPANCQNMAKGALAPGMFNGICRDVPGGFAPFAAAHQSQLFKMPEGLSPRLGALTEPAAVAVQAVLDNLPGNKDKVLVIGGGVIGQMIVWALRAMGLECDITVSEPFPFAQDMAKRAGADHIIKDGNLFTAAARITDAERYSPVMGDDICMGGFTKIFDCVGTGATINIAMRCLAGRGVLSVVGIGDDVKLDLTPLWLKIQTIKGVFAYGYNMVDGKREHAFTTSMRLALDHSEFLESMITHTFSLGQYKELIQTNLDKGKTRAVKTMFAF
ncbi:zinc-dependent alcohol dehydrogenase [Desulfatibacillum alkenivorans]|jgi:threonine dehydrogenase-like Zn-dependent dehydrogenase|nr:alcohol dehydrogenase catalytic domain-containing protein [Desulfatibacillum alkenivorans]